MRRHIFKLVGLLLGAACSTNPCPSSSPLYCPQSGKCCQTESPYHCGDTCYASQAAAVAACANGGSEETCTASGGGGGGQSGYQQCENAGNTPLYCDTYSGPQLLMGVPGECCSIGAGATNQVGYLCVYTGGNGVPTTSSGGVCNDQASIVAGCPSNGTVVRCCYGSPC